MVTKHIKKGVIFAIYIGDLRFYEMTVDQLRFEYDEETQQFMMFSDKQFSYTLAMVKLDPNFLVFKQIYDGPDREDSSVFLLDKDTYEF